MKGLLVDLDGVLWFSENHHKEAFIFALSSYVKNAEDLINETWNFGESTEEYLVRIFHQIDLDAEASLISEIAQKKRLRASQIETVPVNHELVESLSILKSSELKIGLVSSSSTKNVQKFLALTGTHDLFDCIVDRSAVTQPKPSPDCYNHAMKRMALSSSNCLTVEDSKLGIESARGAGISKVLVFPVDFVVGRYLEILSKSISQL
jgi:HAD superfamily hydrolase (TIGR01509 family)